MTAKTASERYGPVSSSPTDPWYGIGNVDLDGYGRMLAESFVRCVLRPGTQTKVAGFKEIRYFPGSTSALDEEMQFMRAYFPRAAFIINTRNLADTITSVIKAGHGVSEEEIIGSDLRLREIAARGHPDVWHIHYDDYKRNPEHLRGLFTFLGIPFDIGAVQEVFSKTHSSVTSTHAAPWSP